MPESIARNSFTSDTLELQSIRHWLRHELQQQHCSNDCINDSVLAINEACMNIIQHAYCGRADGEIIIEILRDKDLLIFHLTDFATPVDINKCQSRILDEIRPGGLGIHIIQSVMDSMQFMEPPENKGNLLQLTINIHK